MKEKIIKFAKSMFMSVKEYVGYIPVRKQLKKGEAICKQCIKRKDGFCVVYKIETDPNYIACEYAYESNYIRPLQKTYKLIKKRRK